MSRIWKWAPFSRADLRDPRQKNALYISLSQCATAFSLNFVNIFVPFYVFRVSPYSQRETLLWVGAIVSLNGIFTAITSPIWGSLTHRLSPKKLYQRGMIAHSILFLLMGFTTDLHVLVALRIVQGIFGGVSTIGLILVSSSSEPERMPSNLGLFQSSLTLGQLTGPPLGTLAAAAFGYKGAFISGSILLFATFLFCQFQVTDVPKLPKPAKSLDRRHFDKRILFGWTVCFMVQVQLMFLPSILPKVLENFDFHGPLALKLAGVVVGLYSAGTVVGTYAWTRLAPKFGLVRLITALLLVATLFQVLLVFARGIFDFTVIRMVQTGMVGAVIPLVMSMFASRQRGSTIGLLNASRFTGNAMGPLLATSLLAFSSFGSLCIVIGILTMISLGCFRLTFKTDALPSKGSAA
jgi:DHA1 family multidrug resistance protein-like MFS transporter